MIFFLWLDLRVWPLTAAGWGHVRHPREVVLVRGAVVGG